MKKLYTVAAFCLLLMVNAQTFNYWLTGNGHKGSIVGVHDLSKGAYGGGLGLFGQWSLAKVMFRRCLAVYYAPDRVQYAGLNCQVQRREVWRATI